MRLEVLMVSRRRANIGNQSLRNHCFYSVQLGDIDHAGCTFADISCSLNIISWLSTCCRAILSYVLPGPPNSANLRTMLGPISSYSALVWQ